VTDLNGFDEGWDVAIAPGGRIVIGDTDNGDGSDSALACCPPDGTLGPAFDTRGKVTTDFGGYDSGVAIACTATVASWLPEPTTSPSPWPATCLTAPSTRSSALAAGSRPTSPAADR
jgi:hypothetical protein